MLGRSERLLVGVLVHRRHALGCLGGVTVLQGAWHRLPLSHSSMLHLLRPDAALGIIVCLSITPPLSPFHTPHHARSPSTRLSSSSPPPDSPLLLLALLSLHSDLLLPTHSSSNSNNKGYTITNSPFPPCLPCPSFWFPIGLACAGVLLCPPPAAACLFSMFLMPGVLKSSRP